MSNLPGAQKRLEQQLFGYRVLKHLGDGAASRVYADFYLPFEAYLFAAAIYLCITLCLLSVSKLVERRFLGYLAPRKN